MVIAAGQLQPGLPINAEAVIDAKMYAKSKAIEWILRKDQLIKGISIRGPMQWAAANKRRGSCQCMAAHTLMQWLSKQWVRASQPGETRLVPALLLERVKIIIVIVINTVVIMIIMIIIVETVTTGQSQAS